MKAEHVLAVSNELGEGPVWNSLRQMLYWVDIKQSKLYRYTPAVQEYQVIELSTPIMTLGFRQKGGLVVASGLGFAFWDEDANSFEPIIHPEAHLPQNRFNDGGVDPAGRFWAGTMNESAMESPVHALYRLDVDLSMHKIIDDVTISNGLGWSPDRKIMYFTDSFRYKIFAYDYDLSSGAIQNQRVFAEIPKAEGMPDGLSVDSEGGVWSAIWGGYKVIYFDPVGRRVLEVSLPVANVTSCAFGGPDLDELYITTAWTGLDLNARQQQPQAGDLFCLKTKVKGQAEPLFKG